MTVVLKLGGSLLTDKREPETIDRQTLQTVAQRIAGAAVDRLVVVHGGGSFGHPAAETHGVSRTIGTRDPVAVNEIGLAMRRLNDPVVDALLSAGAPAIGLSPRGLARKDAGGALSVSMPAVRAVLDEGFLPVLYGDVIAHAGAGCSVLDGDRLSIGVASGLDGDRLGLCADVPGILDADGAVIPEIDRYDDVSAALEAPGGADVTGGIGGKVRALLEGDRPASIFGIDDLGAFLAGESPGTLVWPSGC